MMNMSSRKLKQYYEELRDVNSQIEEYTTDELIQKKRDILFKIKQEIKHNRYPNLYFFNRVDVKVYSVFFIETFI